MITNRKTKAAVQKFKILKNNDLISSKVLSQFSKLLSFISLQRQVVAYIMLLHCCTVVPTCQVCFDMAGNVKNYNVKNYEISFRPET